MILDVNTTRMIVPLATALGAMLMFASGQANDEEQHPLKFVMFLLGLGCFFIAVTQAYQLGAVSCP